MRKEQREHFQRSKLVWRDLVRSALFERTTRVPSSECDDNLRFLRRVKELSRKFVSLHEVEKLRNSKNEFLRALKCVKNILQSVMFAFHHHRCFYVADYRYFHKHINLQQPTTFISAKICGWCHFLWIMNEVRCLHGIKFNMR